MTACSTASDVAGRLDGQDELSTDSKPVLDGRRQSQPDAMAVPVQAGEWKPAYQHSSGHGVGGALPATLDDRLVLYRMLPQASRDPGPRAERG